MMIWIIENRGRTMLKVMEKLANLSYNKQQGQQTLFTQHLTGRSHETMETKKKNTPIFFIQRKNGGLNYSIHHTLLDYMLL